MSLRRFLLPFVAAFGLATAVFAETTQTQATVARVTGTATVNLPDGSTVPLTAGMKVAQGATITTGADGDVFIESHPGYLTSIKHNSVVAVNEISVTTEGGKVKEEKTFLDLKSGNLVAKLDPTKKAVNNYQVRTPKGVAAARGTIFALMYQGQKYSITVVNGVVSIGPAGDFVVESDIGRNSASTVYAGQYLTNGGTGTINRGLVGDDGFAGQEEIDTRTLLATAVATVALAAQNNLGGTDAAEAAKVAAAVFKVAPGVAAEAAAIIKQSGGDTSSSNPVMQEIRKQVPAAQQGAFDTSASTGVFTTSTSSYIQTDEGLVTTTTTTTTKAQPIEPGLISVAK